MIALIDDPAVVRRILDHLGRWAPEPAGQGPPTRSPRASPPPRCFDLVGIAIGWTQVQDPLNAMLGSAESAPNRCHRPDARKEAGLNFLLSYRLESEDPTVFLSQSLLFNETADLAAAARLLPVGKALVRREGRDLEGELIVTPEKIVNGALRTLGH